MVEKRSDRKWKNAPNVPSSMVALICKYISVVLILNSHTTPKLKMISIMKYCPTQTSEIILTFLALPAMSALAEAPVRWSMCIYTAVNCPELWGLQSFPGFKNAHKLRYTWGSHIVPFTTQGAFTVTPISAPNALSSLIDLELK